MTRTTQGRLERLEQRRKKKTGFDHLTDDELQQRIDDLLVEIVQEVGLDAARAQLAQHFRQETLSRLDVLLARGRIRAA